MWAWWLAASCTPTGQAPAGAAPAEGSPATEETGVAPGTGEGATLPDAPRCGPVVELERAYVVEGETVAFTVRCTEPGADRGDFLLDPPGWLDVEVDEADWRVAWTTGLADAGVHELVVGVAPRDVPGAFPETAVAEVSVADAIGVPGNVPVDPARYTEEWGVPVVHVFTDGPLSTTYQSGEFWFDGVRHALEIKLRGAASLGYPKNSFTLRFPDDQVDLDRFGMGRKDHLILTTTFDDNSYVRQKLVYDLWRDMAEHHGADRLVVRTWFAVLYLDGAYHGLYVAMDKVDDEFVDQHGLDRDGNLYKAINHDANFYAKVNLHAGYEKKEGTPGEGEPGAFADLDELVAFTGYSTTPGFLAEMDDWIVPEEFMDWYCLVNFTAAGDSGGKNAYLYNDPSGDWLFRYVPWDFNHSWGQDWMTLRVDPSWFDDFTWTNAVFNHFLSDAATREVLYDRMRDYLSSGPMRLDHLLGLLDGYYAQIDAAAARDWSVWGADYRAYSGWASWRDVAGDWTDYEGEKAYLYDWVAQRVDWWAVYYGLDP